MNNQNYIQDNIDTQLRITPNLLFEGKLEVIVKYNGDILYLQDTFDAVELLNNSYAIITGTTEQIRTLYTNPNIEYIELPKTLEYELSNSRYSACITRVQSNPFNLTGKGTAIGIIDSGIDYTHNDFRNADGTSRILYIWDQTTDGNAPKGFRSGYEYTNAEINQALLSPTPFDVLNFRDSIGHGTAVAGIAAGNGNQSNGREKGVAPESSLIVVKLGRRGFGAFPRTTEIMRGIKYVIDKARELQLPVSINLSFGTNNGSHSGDSLFERYINDVSEEWKCVISVSMGNEGDTSHHFSTVLSNNDNINIPISVSNAPKRMYITLWKNFADTINFTITSPSNERSPEIIPTQDLYRFTLSNTDITVFYGQPTNYTQYQEVYFLFESRDLFITEGIWNINAEAINIVDGRFDMWLPTVEDVSRNTAFSFPDINVTLTLPSSAERVISVAGYNANTNTIAAFSGRGYTRNDVYIKPDIAAPAVNILTTKTGGGYMQYSGTSFASPFVAGSASLMMEWGIVLQNDIFLYGQRVKAFLQKGAKRSPNNTYPNNYWGYGTLCLSNTMDLLVQYNQGGFVL